MSFRYTLITEFLYGQDANAIADRLRDAFGGSFEVGDGYVHGRFSSSDERTPRDWFEAADGIGAAFAVITEDGDVWQSKGALAIHASSPVPSTDATAQTG